MRRLAGMIAAAAATIAAPGAGASDTATPATWRTADADTEIFLLGTFHILPKDLNWRTAAIDKAFNDAGIVYFEAETDAPDAQPRTLSVLMSEGFAPQGSHLSDIMDPADVAALKSISAAVGLPFAGVDPMRPWNAFLTLSVQFIIQQGFDPGAGVDAVLLAEARTKGKDIRFFETLEEQLALFTGLSPETEKALLEITVREWDDQKRAFNSVFDAWRTGDTAFIDAEMNRTMRDEAPTVYDRLLVDRNKAWADTIEQTMGRETGTIFVAVGAAHLVGDQSVQAMLEKRGVVFTRVETAANDNEPETASPDAQTDAIADLLEAADGD